MSQEEIDKLMRESRKWRFVDGGQEIPELNCEGFCLIVLKRFGLLPLDFHPTTPMDWHKFVSPVSVAQPMGIVLLEREEYHMGISIDKFSFLYFTRQGLCLDRIYDSKIAKTIRGFYKID